VQNCAASTAESHNTIRASPVSCGYGMPRMVLTLGAARCGVKPFEASVLQRMSHPGALAWRWCGSPMSPYTRN